MTFGQLAIYSQKNLEKDINTVTAEESDESIKYAENVLTEDIEIENFPPFIREPNIEESNLELWEEVEINEYDYGNMHSEVTSKQIKSRSETSNKICKICQFCGKNVANINVHIQRCHGNFKCKSCQQRFKTKQELELHDELHGNNQFPCEICKLSFKKAYDFAIHSRDHSGSKTYKCPLCEFRSASRPSMKIHIKHHEKDYRYYCELCGRGFINKSVYTEHVEAHSGIKRFQCDICNKSFLYSRYLKVHRKLNHKKILEGVEEINECHVCHRRFSFTKSLIRHLSKIHGIGKDNSVHCPLCLKKISNPYNLKMHMRTHTGEKPFVCETCGKTFSKKIYLKKHLHSHEILLEIENQPNDDDDDANLIIE